MTEKLRVLTSALRERRSIWFPLGLWVLITATAAITGPFQTYDYLAPLPRTLYWGFVVAVSILVSIAHLRFFDKYSDAARIISWLPFAFGFAAFLQALNTAVFDFWSGWPDYLWLVGVVFSISMLTELAAALLMPASKSRPAPQQDPFAALMERLPLEKRGRLIRIEAQDHYLSIVTSAGESLILMRLSDAEALLAGADGLRVHRSHWVMRTEVQQHNRREGRDFLVMSDGAEVPVSRGSRPKVVDAGLILARSGI
jgi:hypothetical protein